MRSRGLRRRRRACGGAAHRSSWSGPGGAGSCRHRGDACDARSPFVVVEFAVGSGVPVRHDAAHGAAGARRREPGVARQILLLQVLRRRGPGRRVAVALAAYDARRDARATATDRAVAVAQAVADSPTVARGGGRHRPDAALQPYAEQVRVDTASTSSS